MDTANAQQLRYSLKYAGHPAGEQRLTVEPRREGLRLTLEASVDLPLPKTRQRWESELDPRGLPRKYRERVEGGGTRVMEVEFSREDGLVTVSQGKEDFAVPYLAEMHDPLSLILAVGALSLEVGGVQVFPMVGGRAYAERLPDQTIQLAEGQKEARVYRLRPGLSLLYFDEADLPVRLTQRVGEHVFEADLVAVQRLEPGQRLPRAPEPAPRGGRAPERAPRPAESGQRAQRGPERDPNRPRVVSGEPSPPGERDKDPEGASNPNRRRRRRRRYN